MININVLENIITSLSNAIEASNNLHFCGGGENRLYWRNKAEKHLKEVNYSMPGLLLNEQPEAITDDAHLRKCDEHGSATCGRPSIIGDRGRRM